MQFRIFRFHVFNCCESHRLLQRTRASWTCIGMIAWRRETCEQISLLLEDTTWLALCDSCDRDNDRVLACNGPTIRRVA